MHLAVACCGMPLPPLALFTKEVFFFVWNIFLSLIMARMVISRTSCFLYLAIFLIISMLCRHGKFLF